MSNTDRNSILATALAELTAEELADVLRLRSEIVAGTKHGAEPTWRVTVIRGIKSIRECLHNGLVAAREQFASGTIANGVTFLIATTIAHEANKEYRSCRGASPHLTPFSVEAMNDRA